MHWSGDHDNPTIPACFKTEGMMWSPLQCFPLLPSLPNPFISHQKLESPGCRTHSKRRPMSMEEVVVDLGSVSWCELCCCSWRACWQIPSVLRSRTRKGSCCRTGRTCHPRKTCRKRDEEQEIRPEKTQENNKINQKKPACCCWH